MHTLIKNILDKGYCQRSMRTPWGSISKQRATKGMLPKLFSFKPWHGKSSSCHRGRQAATITTAAPLQRGSHPTCPGGAAQLLQPPRGQLEPGLGGGQLQDQGAVGVGGEPGEAGWGDDGLQRIWWPSGTERHPRELFSLSCLRSALCL